LISLVDEVPNKETKAVSRFACHRTPKIRLMRLPVFIIAMFIFGNCLIAQPKPGLQPNSLCSRDEQIVFSCTVKRGSKIVSLCGSKDLAKDRGYLQYRFGLPNKIELEFPQSRTGTQEQFRYSHYFRYQVDLTEISFNINGYAYQIFDTYNGEEKPKISEEGVTVTAPGKPKDVTLVCRSKAKADYSLLPDVLSNDQQ
jgi:hypothetical protein